MQEIHINFRNGWRKTCFVRRVSVYCTASDINPAEMIIYPMDSEGNWLPQENIPLDTIYDYWMNFPHPEKK